MSGESQDDTGHRQFHTLDVVGAATGILVNPVGLEGLQDVLGYMLGDPHLLTHQIPDAIRAARPHLLARHPWLADADPPRGDVAALLAWNDTVVAERGARLPLVPATNPVWTRGRAVADLVDRLGPDRVLTLVSVTGEE